MAAISTDLITPTINEDNEATQNEVETISTQQSEGTIVTDTGGVNSSLSPLLEMTEKTDESSPLTPHLQGKHEHEHEESPSMDDEPPTPKEKETVDSEPEENTTSDSSNETSNIKKLAAILFAVPVAQILHLFV